MKKGNKNTLAFFLANQKVKKQSISSYSVQSKNRKSAEKSKYQKGLERAVSEPEISLNKNFVHSKTTNSRSSLKVVKNSDFIELGRQQRRDGGDNRIPVRKLADVAKIKLNSKYEGKINTKMAQTSSISNFPLEDSEILVELAEADKKAHKTAEFIEEIRKKITEYTKKEDLTDENIQELMSMQTRLMEKLYEFEVITKNIQKLTGIKEWTPEEGDPTVQGTAGYTSGVIKKSGVLKSELPKVIMCHSQAQKEQEELPKVIVCDGPGEKGRAHYQQIDGAPPFERYPVGLRPGGDQLGAPNSQFPDSRHFPQQQAPWGGGGSQCPPFRLKSSMPQGMFGKCCISQGPNLNEMNYQKKQQAQDLESQIRNLVRENIELKKQLACSTGQSPACNTLPTRKICKRMLFEAMGLPMPEKEPSPNNKNKDMGTSVSSTENEVDAIQTDSISYENEKSQKEEMENQNKCNNYSKDSNNKTSTPNYLDSNLEDELKELRDKYQQLKEDHDQKVNEITALRNKLKSLKKGKNDTLALLEEAKETEVKADNILNRLEDIEDEKKKFQSSEKYKREIEHQLKVCKKKLSMSEEEIDELHCTLRENCALLEEYRLKYLHAQEQVEEQRHMLNMMQLEKQKIDEKINYEIQHVKSEYQTKLEDLAHYSELLNATQLKLKEIQQLRMISETSCEELAGEICDLREQNEKLSIELSKARNSSLLVGKEKAALQNILTDGDKKIEEIKNENFKLKENLAHQEELTSQWNQRYEEKEREVIQLQSQLELTRGEMERQANRMKDRLEANKNSLQHQISELECQLAQSHAATRAAQKDRDEVKQKLGIQVTLLCNNYQQAQSRIQSLQHRVNILKTSYYNMLEPGFNQLPYEEIKSLTKAVAIEPNTT